MKQYEQLLDDLYASLPAVKSSGERFEIPVALVVAEGNKCFIKNFDFVCSKLRRKQEEVAKYLFKELATPGLIGGGRLSLQAKVNPRLVNEKVQQYVEQFVLCKECGKPDTHVEAIDRNISMLVCEACGARRPVRS